MTTLCPGCRFPVSESSTPFYPFCSERCRTIDLGAWLSADYRIPEDSRQPASVPVEETPSQDP
ncbi:MAG: DNA gyrase inhibitor YacG [Nitrospira sp.]|nr:DNA gyrase inhibitor YacG [Nitrospira sp.]